MKYIGVDVHKDNCVHTAINEQGEVLVQSAFLNDKHGIDSFAEYAEDGKVVMEASTFSLPIYYLLKEKQINVVLAHPKKVRWIAEAKIKTDASDSEKLARLLKADLIPTAYAPTQEARKNRELVRHRDSLVKMKTCLKNSIHAILAKEAVRYEGKDLFGKKGRVFLKSLTFSSANQLQSNLTLLEALEKEIGKSTSQIEAKAREDKNAWLLTGIPGISHISALVLVSEIDSIARFGSHEKLASYFGLVPSLHQSGHVSRSGHIHKQGSRLARSILVQDANAAIRVSRKLRRFYHKIRKKKGHNIAIIAVAHKLVKYIFWVLTHQKEFVNEPQG